MIYLYLSATAIIVKTFKNVLNNMMDYKNALINLFVFDILLNFLSVTLFTPIHENRFHQTLSNSTVLHKLFIVCTFLTVYIGTGYAYISSCGFDWLCKS